MDEYAPVVEVSRGLKEVILWRYVAEMMRRYPHRLWACQAEKETWDDKSQPNLLRVAVAFPHFDGQYIDFDLFDRHTTYHAQGEASAFASVWPGAISDDGGLKAFLNHILDDIQMHGYESGHMPPTSPDTLVYRVMAGISAATVFNNHTWRWVNTVRLDGMWLNPALRTDLLRSFPALDVPEPRYADIGSARNDPAYRCWILTRDGNPVVCLSTDGYAQSPEGGEVELMSIYDGTRKGGSHGRIEPVVHAVGQDFLP